jgi:Tfp pilus assembly protein PilO
MEETITENFDPNVENKTRQILSIVGVVLLIGSVAFFAFFLRPLWNDHGEMQSEIDGKELQVSTIQTKIDEYKESERKMDLGSEVQKRTLLNSIPVGVNQDEIIEDLVDIAADNNIEFHSVSFGLSDGVYEDVGALRISASFQGGYGDLIHFLKGLESNARLIKVTAINVQVEHIEDVNVNKVTFSLTMDSYYQ